MADESIHQPHDKVFKAAFSDVRVAKDFLSHHLSFEQKSLFDFDTLTLCPGSFITPELQKFETDILYKVKLKQLSDNENPEAHIYLLMEHMSTADPWLPLRLVGYLQNIWEQYKKQNPKAKTLPLVIPLVLYNGNKQYPYSMSFLDLFGHQKPLAIEILSNPFKLVDLNLVSDETIRHHTWCGLVEFMLKNAARRDALTLVQEAFSWFQLENVRDYMVSVIKYLTDQGSVPDEKKLFSFLKANLPKDLGDEVMTIAQQLEQRGIILGKAELFENLLKNLGDEEKAAKMAMVSLEDFRRTLKLKKEYEATKH